jgi:nicotinate-nucleotide adenylyltransferase
MRAFSRSLFDAHDFGSVRIRTPMAMPGERIGLLGGSFNPAHAGHLEVSQAAIRRLGLARLWWIVSPGNPIKTHDALEPLAARVAEARRLAAADHRIVVTSFEAELPTPFTAATVSFLRRRYPVTRFVWLMGGDCLAEFHRWREWRSIFATMPVAVLDRPGFRLGAVASPAAHRFARARLPEDCAALLPALDPPAWTYLTIPLSPLSSTALRRSAP